MEGFDTLVRVINGLLNLDEKAAEQYRQEVYLKGMSASEYCDAVKMFGLTHCHVLGDEKTILYRQESRGQYTYVEIPVFREGGLATGMKIGAYILEGDMPKFEILSPANE